MGSFGAIWDGKRGKKGGNSRALNKLTTSKSYQVNYYQNYYCLTCKLFCKRELCKTFFSKTVALLGCALICWRVRAKCKTPKKPAPADLISQAQACKRLGISKSTLKRWRIAGEFGHYKFRGTIKFDSREIEAYKRSHRVGPPLPPNLSLYPLPPVHDDRAEESAVSASAGSTEATIGGNGGQP